MELKKSNRSGMNVRIEKWYALQDFERDMLHGNTYTDPLVFAAHFEVNVPLHLLHPLPPS